MSDQQSCWAFAWKQPAGYFQKFFPSGSKMQRKDSNLPAFYQLVPTLKMQDQSVDKIARFIDKKISMTEKKTPRLFEGQQLVWPKIDLMTRFENSETLNLQHHIKKEEQQGVSHFFLENTESYGHLGHDCRQSRKSSTGQNEQKGARFQAVCRNYMCHQTKITSVKWFRLNNHVMVHVTLVTSSTPNLSSTKGFARHSKGERFFAARWFHPRKRIIERCLKSSTFEVDKRAAQK